MSGSCATCRWSAELRGRGKGKALECRKSAPGANPKNGLASWPLVQPDMSCGSYSARDRVESDAAEHFPNCICLACLRSRTAPHLWGRLSASAQAQLEKAYPEDAKRLRECAERAAEARAQLIDSIKRRS